jgi:intron-binding protein aquarius
MEDSVFAIHTRPTVADLHGENHFAQLARKNWLNPSKPPKINQKIVKEELWDVLEKSDFAFGSLLVLENLQLLER